MFLLVPGPGSVCLIVSLDPGPDSSPPRLEKQCTPDPSMHGVYLYLCPCVCVCACAFVAVCVCVCVRESETETEGKKRI